MRNFVSGSTPGMIQYGFGACTVETHPAGEHIPFGAAVTVRNGRAFVATNGDVDGVAVVSHIMCNKDGGFDVGHPVPVLTHGVITVKVNGAAQQGARLNYHGTNAAFQATGGNELSRLTVIAKEAATASGNIDVQVLTTK